MATPRFCGPRDTGVNQTFLQEEVLARPARKDIGHLLTVDKPKPKHERLADMKQRKPAPRKKPLDYPDETEGSRLAEEIRRQTNKLTMEQRRQLFQEARTIIYGGERTAEATRSRHKSPA